MLNIITNTVFGLLGAAAGLFLYRTGAKQGYNQALEENQDEHFERMMETMKQFQPQPTRSTTVTETRTVDANPPAMQQN